MALLALTSPVMAHDYGQIVLKPPVSNNLDTVLNLGDTVTHTGAGAAIDVAGSNRVDGNGVAVIASGTDSVGLQAASGGTISLIDSSIDNRGEGNGVYAQNGGRIELDGGSVTAAAGNGVHATGAGSIIATQDLTITAVGSNGPIPDWVSGVYAENGARVSLDGGKIQITGGFYGNGVAVDGAGSVVKLSGTEIVYFSGGSTVFVTHGGGFEMVGGSLKMLDSNGLRLADGGSIKLTGVDIQHGENGGTGVGYGVLVDDSPGNTNTVTLENVTLASTSNALYVRGGASSLSAYGSAVQAIGDFAKGLMFGDGAAVTLDNTRMLVEGGPDSVGIQGVSSYSGMNPSTLTIRNGSQISTKGRYALGVADSGPYAFLVADSSIIARDASDDDTKGVLLWSMGQNAQANLDASNAFLKGDLVAEEGTIDVALRNGSTLTGAVQQYRGRVNSLALDGGSTWNVRGDSTLGTLSNAGVVAFATPADGSGFKTLTVSNYAGGGTLVLNTRLGDDASATDKLVIDGGSATGNTGLRVINAGGAGNSTGTGIRVVQTINGGTTAPGAFHLDAGSTGYRASAGTIALNGYDYSLVQGGNGGAAPDWYLTSTYSTPQPDPAVQPPSVVQPVPIVQPLKPGFQNVSPESGAYAGNQLASTRLFMHGLHDRVAAYGATSAGTPDADGAIAGPGRGLWTRVQGRQDSGLRMSEGRVDVATDSMVLQLGADLIRVPVSRNGSLYAGLMGGYGDARSRSLSTMMLPGGVTAKTRAHGKVSGYSVGVYGTAYQNDATRLGAYADSWLQLGRYRNQIDSEVGSARYRSTVLSASVEAGYAVAPFAAGSALGAIVLEPHAQFVYSRYGAQDATLQDTRMRPGNANTWNSRIGVRVYPQAAAAPVVRPFLEANWLHNFGNPSVQMGPNTLDAAPSRNSLELKLGAEGRIGRAVRISGHVFSQAGSGDQGGYGGMLNVGYRW